MRLLVHHLQRTQYHAKKQLDESEMKSALYRHMKLRRERLNGAWRIMHGSRPKSESGEYRRKLLGLDSHKR